jgi:hypothetical protein
MGERRARWGYGYQDKVATDRLLNFLRRDLREGAAAFEGVRLADLEAGRVDDFVLVWRDAVEGNSIKWSAEKTPSNWADLVGASGLLRELADGYARLRGRWPGRAVTVRLQTSRPASTEKHHAQLIPSISVAEFLADHWAVGPGAPASADVADTWHRIAEHTGLSGTDLSAFVACCELSFGQAEPTGNTGDSHDAKHHRRQFDSLHKAIATWLTNAPHEEWLDRDYLLGAIGYQASRSGLIQRFPDPDIPYEKNDAAAARLKAMVDGTAGGYLAIVGPAGIGKSTLVQDVLTDSSYPFFIPYYAFLPNTDGNRDRAEALTFFQDVVGRLDRFDTKRRSLGVADVAQGRDALRRHMASANQRYVMDGHKTILLIDGLDHVMREAALQTPVLRELPHPDEVPEGVLVVLSGQPQAFLPGSIPPPVASAVEPSGRRLEVSGLTRSEVHALVAKVAKPTTGPDRDTLYDACLGNPLILTYLLALFEGADGISIDGAVELAGRYEGQIDSYYQERLSVPLQNSPQRRLLGLLCRAAPGVPLAWLHEWPENDGLVDVYRRVLAPFVRVEDGCLQFIHDSLIAFLKVATRSPLPGSNPVTEDRLYYSALADRASGRASIDTVGRARIQYLLRAERYDDMLAQLSSDWLRAATRGFLPYAQIHPTLLSGLNAACATNRWGDVLRLILLSHELGNRTSRLDAAQLAGHLLGMDEPLLALAQVRSDGRLLVDDNEALRFAGTLARYAQLAQDEALSAAARRLYLQAKPLTLFYAKEALETSQYKEHNKSLAAWSEVAALFEPPEVLAGAVERLTFTSRDNADDLDPLASKAQLLFRLLDGAIEAGRAPQECRLLSDAMAGLGSAAWRFIGLLRLMESTPEGVTVEELRAAHVAETNDDIELAYAWCLTRLGHVDEARRVAGGLRHIRFEAIPEARSWGFSDVTYSVRLRWLQERLGLPEGPVPGVTDDRDEATARAERTARQLGHLRALVAAGQGPTQREELFRSLLLFHNQAVAFATIRPHQDYVLNRSRRAIYEQVAALAGAMGPHGLSALRSAVLDLTTGPARTQFTPSHRRYFAEFFFDHETMSRADAIKLGLSATEDAAADDPAERQEACLEIARLVRRLGDREAAAEWLARASEVSAGAGSHKDYHMAHVADWLQRSIGEVREPELHALDRFARAVEVAGGRGGSDGAGTVLRILVGRSPARAWQLGVEWLDRSVLNVAEVLEALIVGAAGATAHPELLAAIFGELYSLLAVDDASTAALAILDAVPTSQKGEMAERLMSQVRTNTLPSQRVQVARALGDALRAKGLEPVSAQNLKPGKDDSSQKSTLYRLANGETETIDQMATRLSDEERQDAWNPNPNENSDFDWWAAIKVATLRGRGHLDLLVSRFPLPDYRAIELLARQAELLLDSDDRAAAMRVSEEAIDRARDGSWSYWRDGAQKMVAFASLKRVDRSEGVARAREEFAKDLAAGKLSMSYLLAEIDGVLDLLDVAWPAAAARDAVADYAEQVLLATHSVPPLQAFAASAPSWSPDQALCRTISELLAFPVANVGFAARRVLGRYVAVDGRALVSLLTEPEWWNPLQLEHLLIAVHMGSGTPSPRFAPLRAWIEGFSQSESLAVRSIARRIVDAQGWAWQDVSTEPASPVVLLAPGTAPVREAGMLLGGDVLVAWELHRLLIELLERAGLDVHELRSDFEHVYHVLKGEYPWADDDRLKRWMKLCRARFWLSPRAIIGREAGMRVFGRRALSGQVPPGGERFYDELYPIYDSALELLKPSERPPEFRALEWRITGGEEDAWRKGAEADRWSHYPETVGGLSLIGERTCLIRPEWEWPREERHRGLVLGPSTTTSGRRGLRSAFDLTYEMYAIGRGQADDQLIVSNEERQLPGGVGRWVALNANFARALGWRLSDHVPFQWLDSTGTAMVTSTYWQDGWTWLEPPRFESLGEGWFVTATAAAVEAIRQLAPGTDLHLWVERHSHGDRASEGKWHLARLL